MKRGRGFMGWTLAVAALLIAGILIWFVVPYSPARAAFGKLATYQIGKTTTQAGIITLNDVADLPRPVQKHFQYCGYIGKAKMANMSIHFDDVDFVLDPSKPKLKIKYTQYNSVDEPERIAYIDTRLYGIPFGGIDAYQNGAGSMKGVIAKAITLFDQKGAAMDRASLVTFLSESLFLPTAALQDYISWQEIDETHAQAVINYYGISASGIFTFDDNGAMVSFTTDDRENTDTQGNIRKAKWSALCADYREVDGIKFPANLKAVWHFETGDLVYFDGREITVKYDVSQ